MVVRGRFSPNPGSCISACHQNGQGTRGPISKSWPGNSMRRGNRDFCAPCVGYRGDSHGTLQHIATTRGAAFPVRTWEIATMKLFPKSGKYVAGDGGPSLRIDHPSDRSTHRSRRDRGRRCDGGTAMNANLPEGLTAPSFSARMSPSAGCGHGPREQSSSVPAAPSPGGFVGAPTRPTSRCVARRAPNP